MNILPRIMTKTLILIYFRIEGGAEFSFDFVCYLVVAACLAFMGKMKSIIDQE